MDSKEQAKVVVDWYEASLKEDAQDDIAAYVKRGRQHKGVPTADLQARYIQLFNEYCATEIIVPSPLLDDIGSELSLRSADVPSSAIDDARKRLIDRLTAALDRAKHDPEVTRRFLERALRSRGPKN
jgi:hypothetical protein